MLLYRGKHAQILYRRRTTSPMGSLSSLMASAQVQIPRSSNCIPVRLQLQEGGGCHVFRVLCAQARAPRLGVLDRRAETRARRLVYNRLPLQPS